jgi:hypothetical protein
MMHDREKSDSAIVAGKPTNKARQPAAEPAEPRAGAKGNAGQQSTRRTQSRASMLQALECIRRVAVTHPRSATRVWHRVNAVGAQTGCMVKRVSGIVRFLRRLHIVFLLMRWPFAGGAPADAAIGFLNGVLGAMTGSAGILVSIWCGVCTENSILVDYVTESPNVGAG